MKINKADANRLEIAYGHFYFKHYPDFDTIAEHLGFGSGARKAIRGIFNKFVKAELNLDTARDIIEKGYAANPATLRFYIAYIGKRDRQLHGKDFCREIVDCRGKEDVYTDCETMRGWLLGLTAKYPELLIYSNTHGLDCLTIQPRPAMSERRL